MIRCVIIDDEQPAIDVIKKYIARLPGLDLAGESTSPIAGISLIRKEKPDLVFLDVQMEEMSGIELMREIAGEALVIFCTAHAEFAVTSYDLRAVDYLMKPVEFPRFELAVQRAVDILSNRLATLATAIAHDYIFVKVGQRGKMIKIDLDDIDLIEGMNNYVAFHRGSVKTLAYLTMKELEIRLPASQFMRVHKSYIVALKLISAMENNELVLKKIFRRIPIGSSYKEAFLERIKDRLMS